MHIYRAMRMCSVYTYVQSYGHAYIHNCVLSVHTYIQNHVLVQCIYIYECIYMSVYAYIQSYSHTYIQIYVLSVYTYIHDYVHTALSVYTYMSV